MEISPSIRLVMDELLLKCNTKDWNYNDGNENEPIVKPWNIPKTTGEFLYNFIVNSGHRGNDIKRILELGTGTGYSGLWLGAAARRLAPCTIDTVDYYDRKITIAHDVFKQAKLDDIITIYNERIISFLKKSKPAYYDFIFLDADKNNYHHYFSYLLKVAKQGATLVVDNAINYADRMILFTNELEKNKQLKVELVNNGNGLLVITFPVH